ncbi:RecT family recombinase [Clostridium tertium]|uniref:RecT family recombinase n=1 Tax=Clostridium tertium TaxID=1559 RepID=UPI0024B3675B|nr:RecT family recombinase [Clostridium tertium]MDI9215977.1 recombinase RecT [Clostridium tertium]
MANKETGLTLTKEDALNNVVAKIESLKKSNDIVLPANYNEANAINAAWLMLQDVKCKVGNEYKPALEVCSKNSIIESLYNMTIQGLNPVKKQCYFVPYSGKLTLMRSYMGTVAVTKRLKGVKDVKAFAIYDGDKFDMTFNKDTYNIDFDYEPKFQNIDNKKIKGAFAIVIGDNGEKLHTEIMTMEQIKKAWSMSKTYKNDSKVHNDFTEEMAKKTVINRACKKFFNTSDDNDLLVESLYNTNDSLEDKYSQEDIIETIQAEVKEEIKEEANKEFIDVPVEEIQPKEVQVEIVKEPSNKDDDCDF